MHIKEKEDGALVPVKEAAKGIRVFFYKDGSFSKTAVFATIANFLVLFAYAISLLAGTVLDGSLGSLTIPSFDAGAATALLGIVNATYLSNNLIKTKKPTQ